MGSVMALFLAFTVTPAHLPNPSGPFSVGRVAYDWTDQTRPELLSPNRNTRRELMVYIWYPSEAKTHSGVPAAYFPGAKQIERAPGTQAIRDDFESTWPLVAAGAISSPVRENVPVARSAGGFPVILFSHGLGGSSFEYTCLLGDPNCNQGVLLPSQAEQWPTCDKADSGVTSAVTIT